MVLVQAYHASIRCGQQGCTEPSQEEEEEQEGGHLRHHVFKFCPERLRDPSTWKLFHAVQEAQDVIDEIVAQKVRCNKWKEDTRQCIHEVKESEEWLELLNFGDVPSSQEWQGLSAAIAESKKDIAESKKDMAAYGLAV